jgi:hypothetical protein
MVDCRNLQEFEAPVDLNKIRNSKDEAAKASQIIKESVEYMEKQTGSSLKIIQGSYL